MTWHTIIDAADIGESGDVWHRPSRQPKHNQIIVAAHSAVLLEANHGPLT
jgi:hypothetical protein